MERESIIMAVIANMIIFDGAALILLESFVAPRSMRCDKDRIRTSQRQACILFVLAFARQTYASV